MNSHKNWESWFTWITPAHKFIRDSATYFRWFHSLCIVKPWSNFKLYAIIVLTKDSTHHSTTAACTLLVSDNSCLSILKLFNLEQKVWPFTLIKWVRVFNHHSFASISCHLVKLLSEMLKVFALIMGMNHHMLRIQLVNHIVHFL